MKILEHTLNSTSNCKNPTSKLEVATDNVSVFSCQSIKEISRCEKRIKD